MAHLQLNARMQLAERTQIRQQKLFGDGVGCPQAQLPVLQGLHTPQFFFPRIQSCQRSAHAGTALPFLCQSYAFPAAHKQPRAQLLFQLLHRLGDGRLGQKQLFGTCAELPACATVTKIL